MPAFLNYNDPIWGRDNLPVVSPDKQNQSGTRGAIADPGAVFGRNVNWGYTPSGLSLSGGGRRSGRGC